MNEWRKEEIEKERNKWMNKEMNEWNQWTNKMRSLIFETKVYVDNLNDTYGYRP